MPNPAPNLEFTPDAKLLVIRYKDRLSRIGQMYGFKSEQYAEAAGSLANSLCMLIGLGGRISTEGEMLYGRNEYIDFGVVCHDKAGMPDFPTNIGTDPMGTWSVNS